MNWLKWPLEHYPITLLLITILFGMGIYGMYVMPKDEFPAFTIRQGVVIAVYPGATTEEVEEQVARPLERYLFTYGEVNRKKTTTTSQNGMCMVLVRLNDDVNNKDEVWSKIKHGLTLFKQSLPSGVLALVANDDFGNTSALLIAIESNERSYRELQGYTDRLSDRLCHRLGLRCRLCCRLRCGCWSCLRKRAAAIHTKLSVAFVRSATIRTNCHNTLPKTKLH